MKNPLWLVLCCALPILLIFLLPVLGVSGSIALFLAVVLIFVMHFFLMGGHRGEQGNRQEERHEHH